jgi:hypothetical protein
METLRLRRIQQPSELERLLEEFVSGGGFLPKTCDRIRDARELSPQSRWVLARKIEQGHVWACWANSFQTWLFTCEMSLARSRERGAPVLTVNLFDETGELKEAGTWVAGRDGKWSCCLE